MKDQRRLCVAAARSARNKSTERWKRSQPVGCWMDGWMSVDRRGAEATTTASGSTDELKRRAEERVEAAGCGAKWAKSTEPPQPPDFGGAVRPSIASAVVPFRSVLPAARAAICGSAAIAGRLSTPLGSSCLGPSTLGNAERAAPHRASSCCGSWRGLPAAPVAPGR